LISIPPNIQVASMYMVAAGSPIGGSALFETPPNTGIEDTFILTLAGAQISIPPNIAVPPIQHLP
jgi:hypothetical protein